MPSGEGWVPLVNEVATPPTSNVALARSIVAPDAPAGSSSMTEAK